MDQRTMIHIDEDLRGNKRGPSARQLALICVNSASNLLTIARPGIDLRE